MRADVDAQVHQVAVAELDPLGAAGGARGVDDRGQGLRAQGRGAPIELAGVHASAGLDEPQHVLAPHAQDLQVRQLGDCGRQRSDHGGHGLVLHNDKPHPGVGENPLSLLSRGRLIDGHHHQARLPGGEVQQRPLVRGVRHDADGVAGLKALCDEACGHLAHFGAEGAGAHLSPASPQWGRAGDESAVGVAPHALGQCPGRRHAVMNRDPQLGGVFLRRGGEDGVGRGGGGVGHGGKYARPERSTRSTPVVPCAWTSRSPR